MPSSEEGPRTPHHAAAPPEWRGRGSVKQPASSPDLGAFKRPPHRPLAEGGLERTPSSPKKALRPRRKRGHATDGMQRESEAGVERERERRGEGNLVRVEREARSRRLGLRVGEAARWEEVDRRSVREEPTNPKWPASENDPIFPSDPLIMPTSVNIF